MSVIYTCIGKGGRYQFVARTTGSGTSKGQSYIVYRDIQTGVCYHRTVDDFYNRMEEVEDAD